MDERALGRRLQLARKRAGLTQQELCQKAGLSYSTLAKIERGAIRAPSVFTVASIAATTGTSVEELLDMPATGHGSTSSKKRSRSGVSFVYMDINGTMVRFFHKAFTDIARTASVPPEIVETLFWRHHDAVAAGQMDITQFNAMLAGELSLEGFDWLDYYRANVEPMPHVSELVNWIAANYKLGIFSNNFPGVIDELRQNKIVPDVDYDVVVDSSKVGHVKPLPPIYELAQELAGVGPGEILLIDNERPNLTAADRAGWQVLLFDEINPEESVERARKLLEF